MVRKRPPSTMLYLIVFALSNFLKINIGADHNYSWDRVRSIVQAGLGLIVLRIVDLRILTRVFGKHKGVLNAAVYADLLEIVQDLLVKGIPQRNVLDRQIVSAEYP